MMPRCWCLICVLISFSAALPPDCPVQLLSVQQDGHAELSEEGLTYLQSLRSPLYVVPVLGVYRSGKSFLLNRCMGLKAPYTGGFGVGHTQDTHTRGINVCAEDVEDLGTVVWMDTEGLFASEHALSTYGPKIFSLAMLFSSTVLLNSVKVLNDQFFSFFSEQQQIARVLRHGLLAEGLPEDALLPKNLSLVWVLQQPVGLDERADSQLREQLQAFLGTAGDEARDRVRRDFNHHLHMVPAATNDVRAWAALDQEPEDNLLPRFKDAAQSLKDLVFNLVRSSRPMPADGVVQQMRMYVNLVETDQFNGKLARETVEESELSSRCAEFGRNISAFFKELPKPGLAITVDEARLAAESIGAEAADNFHFAHSWKTRLNSCLASRVADLLRRNAQSLLELWEEKASRLAEDGSCFFLDHLVALRDELLDSHEIVLDDELRDHTVKFATGLQRARLVECLKLRDLLLPLLPWLVWPAISFYISTGVFSGLWQLGVHSFLLVGAYALLKIFQQLPPYFDTEYPVLQARPQLLDAVMMVIPWMPWARLAKCFCLLGFCWSGVKLARALADRWRPAGDQIGGLVNLELKLNVLLKRSEVVLQQGFLAALQETNAHVAHCDAPSARRALLRGLCMLRGASGEDPQLGAMADARMRQRIARLLDDCQVADEADACSNGFCEAWSQRDVVGCAFRADWTTSVRMAVEVVESSHKRSSVARVGRSRTPTEGLSRRRHQVGGS